MSVMGPDGKIYQPGGSWWSPYGNTDEEIRENMKTGEMPNAEDAMRVGPKYFTGTKDGDEQLSDFLGFLHLCCRKATTNFRQLDRFFRLAPLHSFFHLIYTMKEHPSRVCFVILAVKVVHSRIMIMVAEFQFVL